MTKRVQDSMKLSVAIISGFATVFTILGFSMKDLLPFNCVHPAFLTVILRTIIVLVACVVLTLLIWIRKGMKYKKRIQLKIGKNEVTIKPGNIFTQDGWRVIAVDTHFSTVVDDVIISKSSLHGQLVLDHGDIESIKDTVRIEADKRKIPQEEDGRYTFPLGTAIPYDGNDGTYIMVALTDLDSDNEAHTKMPQYESTLMTIWKEINSVYAKHDLVLPILGAGITRFDDGQDDPSNLLRCMLCTLNTSRIHFKSSISIIVYDGEEKSSKNTERREKTKNSLPLYEYKDLFKIVR